MRISCKLPYKPLGKAKNGASWIENKINVVLSFFLSFLPIVMRYALQHASDRLKSNRLIVMTAAAGGQALRTRQMI